MSSLDNVSYLIDVTQRITACMKTEFNLKYGNDQVIGNREHYDIYFKDDDTHLKISVSLPEFVNFSFVKPTEIHISKKKSFRQIADEIERRLISEVEALLPDLILRKKLADDNQAVIEKNCEDVMRAFGSINPSKDKSPYGGRWMGLHGMPMYGDVYVTNDSMNIRIDNIPVKKALEVLALLKGINK